MDEFIREFLVDPLVAAAESMVFKDLVDRVVGLIKRKKTEAREALNRLRDTPAQDRSPVLAALDPDLKSVLAQAATGPTVAKILSDCIENLRMRTLDYNQINVVFIRRPIY
jgi:hypothetical protein